jgi:hypothetical protein
VSDRSIWDARKVFHGLLVSGSRAFAPFLFYAFSGLRGMRRLNMRRLAALGLTYDENKPTIKKWWFGNGDFVRIREPSRPLAYLSSR